MVAFSELLLLRVAMFVGARGPCNADACNDTIPLGINRLPLLSKEEWRRRMRIEGSKGREGKRNLSAACFAAIKTTEVELLPKRRQSNKEWDKGCQMAIAIFLGLALWA